jgi:hypothetical protein
MAGQVKADCEANLIKRSYRVQFVGPFVKRYDASSLPSLAWNGALSSLMSELLRGNTSCPRGAIREKRGNRNTVTGPPPRRGGSWAT